MKSLKALFRVWTVLLLSFALSACSNQSGTSTEGTSTPAATEKSTAGTEAVPSASTVVTEAPSSAEDVTASERRALSQEELDSWNSWFHEDWYFPGGFLRSEYTDVRKVDFSSLLYNGIAEKVENGTPAYPEIGAEEHAELTKVNQWAAELEIHKIPKALLSEKLLQYTGLKLDDFNAFDAAAFSWQEKYDACYVVHSDSLDTRAKITAGTELPDGSILLEWEIEVEPAKGTVTLKKQDEQYVITANRFN